MEWTSENIEQFICDHKDEFDKYYPKPNHEQHFLIKLYKKFNKIISIVPYLIRVAIATILIFMGSYFTWREYICPPMTHVSLKYWKLEHNLRYQIWKDIRTLKREYIKTPEEKADFKRKLEITDYVYYCLKKELKKYHTPENVMIMTKFYRIKLYLLDKEIEYYKSKLPKIIKL
jgi:hypothetical protein